MTTTLVTDRLSRSPFPVLAFALPIVFCRFLSADDHVEIHPSATVEFASADTARQLLSQRDGFVRIMSPIDRQLRLHTDARISEDEYIRFVAEQAVDWSADEVTKLSTVLEDIRPLLANIQANWPKRIRLIKTTGREEAGAAYCRGAAIVLPGPVVRRDPSELKRLLVHELFHVLSTHSPALRRKLYRIVGFEECSEIELPDGLGRRKITNPDAPAINCVMKINVGGEQLDVAPVLLSKQSEYESLENRTLFSELMFRLVVVRPDGDGWKIGQTNSEPRLLDPKDIPSFHSQIGRNTRYIIHPEEILADNFVHLVFQSENLPDEWLTSKMRAILVAERE